MGFLDQIVLELLRERYKKIMFGTQIWTDIFFCLLSLLLFPTAKLLQQGIVSTASVCLFVFYHDNSQANPPIFTKFGTDLAVGYGKNPI